jgi:spore coat polysaccharide biosynthesis protein SpsF (cytidylyltransferase family)
MIDEPADYQLLNTIAEVLYPNNPDFSAEDIVCYLKVNPHLIKINSHVRKKAPEEL